jgi:hypothetical protein
LTAIAILLSETLRERYQLLAIGWNQQQRIYGTTIHLDIQDEKIWIQQNTTEFDLASDLVEIGVPKQDIVIGFHTLKMRQLFLTGYDRSTNNLRSIPNNSKNLNRTRPHHIIMTN